MDTKEFQALEKSYFREVRFADEIFNTYPIKLNAALLVQDLFKQGISVHKAPPSTILDECALLALKILRANLEVSHFAFIYASRLEHGLDWILYESSPFFDASKRGKEQKAVDMFSLETFQNAKAAIGWAMEKHWIVKGPNPGTLRATAAGSEMVSSPNVDATICAVEFDFEASYRKLFCDQYQEQQALYAGSPDGKTVREMRQRQSLQLSAAEAQLIGEMDFKQSVTYLRKCGHEYRVHQFLVAELARYIKIRYRLRIEGDPSPTEKACQFSFRRTCNLLLWMSHALRDMFEIAGVNVPEFQRSIVRGDDGSLVREAHQLIKNSGPLPEIGLLKAPSPQSGVQVISEETSASSQLAPWDVPGLPERLKKLATELLKMGGKATAADLKNALGWDPSRIYSDAAYKKPRHKKWVNDFIRKEDTGLYELITPLVSDTESSRQKIGKHSK